MPNWCQNSLTITHDDPTMIARAKAAFETGHFFNELTHQERTHNEIVQEDA